MSGNYTTPDVLEPQAVRRGVVTSVKDLNGKLRAHIEGWNKARHHPSSGP